MKNMLEHALKYIARGWYVFPCREKDGLLWQDEKGKLHLPLAKAPYIKQGLLNASTDPTQIRQWWNKWPMAAIGCNCGLSGLFAFDLDCKDGKDGTGSFAMLGIDTGGTLMTMTPSGGLHVIFSGQGKSSSNARTGIDTRGQGGYIILPPSEIFQKGVYDALGNWERTPAALDPEILTRLFPANFRERESKDYPILSQSDEVEKIKKALAAIAPERAQNYDIKIRIGMALSRLGSDGLSLFHQFCRKDTRPGKYNPQEIDEHWERLQSSTITPATIYYYAKQDDPTWYK